MNENLKMKNEDPPQLILEHMSGGGKKSVLINANCHGIALSKFFKISKNFNTQYVIYPLPPVHLNGEKRIDKYILNNVDVFIHQDIRENNSVAYELSDKVTVPQLKRSCINLVIPNLVGFGDWLYPNLGEIVLDNKKGNLIFRDSILDEAIKTSEHANISWYIDFFNNYEYPKDKLDELFQRHWMKLRKRQTNWSIDIYEFIIKHYKSIPIYVDAGHPSKYVMYEIGKRILEILDIENDVILEEYNSALGMPAPAAPKIMEYFDMSYDIPLEPRKSYIFNTIKEKSKEQYIYEYIVEYFYLVYGLKLF